jgi:hypothetical protein
MLKSSDGIVCQAWKTPPRLLSVNQPIPLKLEIDRKTFLTAGFRNMRTRCPHCHNLHIWQKEDITLEPVETSSAH